MSGSFKAFYEATAEGTFRAAYRSAGSRAVAEDATHEAYAVMLAKWPERENHVLRANQKYVIGIALHKVLDWFRRADRFDALSDEADRPAADGAQECLVDYLLLYEEVRQVLMSSPMVSRTVGILYFLEGFTPKEVADALDMAPSTVRTHVHRLRGRLRSLVERLGWLDERRYRDA